MYNLRTAKEAREARLREWSVSESVKNALEQFNSKVDEAIKENKSYVELWFPCDEFKESTEGEVGELMELERLLVSYGYDVTSSVGFKGDSEPRSYRVFYIFF
ncbi:gp0.22 [Bacillus phage SPO1]|uniref:Gp0.22 n=3 Tax=Okubovirus TaxID=1857845 RepID=B6V2X1_BPSP1|nr:gp0.22 [Bacillus phage SPO1]YP_008769969.1 hypothetical protein CampHawk_35 [Bacillus phage CampHawk]APZ82273.1 hypothetical protein Goe2_c03300 [Bacillus phage vB_BsuM-Goe2]QMV48564.1 hypothetical protein Goe10_c00330 [Bacillus phage vB_BsuM-Goe10]UAV84305.1 hypothetical protein phi18_035 [Bacillus phage phi18]UNY48978.1 tail length tape-measure protein [Bacillus phage SP82G]WCS68675.1 hypothetical protein Goe19_00310 [Bacillus phage vB_BsuM-Goe19]WIT26564.1 hypothetical protein [Bacillu